MDMLREVKIPHLTPEELKKLQEDLRTRKEMMLNAVRVFEERYQCSLPELERKIRKGEVEEHPTWEDSIEWRNAVEQLERISLSERIFSWLQTLLTRSTT